MLNWARDPHCFKVVMMGFEKVGIWGVPLSRTVLWKCEYGGGGLDLGLRIFEDWWMNLTIGRAEITNAI